MVANTPTERCTLVEGDAVRMIHHDPQKVPASGLFHLADDKFKAMLHHEAFNGFGKAFWCLGS